MFAFARDRGIPHFFAEVNDKTKAPVRTIWLAGPYWSRCCVVGTWLTVQ